ncbi:sirohydrochlorin chelatase [Aquibacillus koreensis]|uniref:Sirohydrochlorin chelatase n=1 Tax=Aquibacillus koreensis TaxID=279446 RepID=A0A9X4AJD7_9BACI|nr:sirohydrochlorin chelatase [Aquibacillus koreensis]MCT2536923.1 sirohydrochlorin chelatase [Aquibacillus koreensis]MDC3421946.1 sirohydrochlorin chelatase [Aquibacillus koreensis]
MHGVLYVSHGTRLDEGKKEAIDFLQSIKKEVNTSLQEICFLEICMPSIQEGVQRLIVHGATTISIIPVLLLSATHDKVDIPDEIMKLKKIYPSISFRYGRPLGIQSRLVDLLVQRVNEVSLGLIEEKIILVGRGSYRKSTQRDIEEIAYQLKGKLKRHVNTCYLAACKPSFDDVLDEWKENNLKTAIIIPYLWFNGLLLKSMKKKVNEYNDERQAQVKICHQLSNHPYIKRAFIDRVNEVVTEDKSKFVYMK